MQDDVFANHLGQVALFQKLVGKIIQLAHFVIVGIGPKEGLLEGLIAVVGKIFCIDPVGDDKNLDILEEAPFFLPKRSDDDNG